MGERQPETREELLQHLEKLTIGAPLLKAKKITLVALLAFGVIQYYILDVLLEIVSMRTTTFFVPVSAPVLKSMIITLA